MTRWKSDLENHPFQKIWKRLLETTNSVEVDDKTVSTTVEELARLKKVITFVDEILANADPELMPHSVINNCQQQATVCLQQVQAYESSKNSGHLVQANENADNLLSYVRPYMVAPEGALKAYGKAVKAFANQVDGYVSSFQNNAKDKQTILDEAVESVRQSEQTLGEIVARIKRFDAYLYEGIDGNGPAEEYLKQMVEDVETQHRDVQALHQKLLVGPNSTSEKVKKSETEIEEIATSMSELKSSSEAQHEDLSDFYDRIFGEVDSAGDRDKGLEQELTARLQQLEQYEGDQRLRHDTLHQQIETLLPGATSAGLASAYKKMKDGFNKPIENFTKAFYVSLAVLLLYGLVTVVETITWTPFHIELVKAANWEELLRTLVLRLPIVLPAVWLVIFSATRRSQYERLQQEYAHKEAFASSYESYKQQLQDLKVEAEEMQRELIAKAIEAIASNASKTLDGNHTEKMPITQVLDKFSFDELCKLIEFSKSAKAGKGMHS